MIHSRGCRNATIPGGNRLKDARAVEILRSNERQLENWRKLPFVATVVEGDITTMGSPESNLVYLSRRNRVAPDRSKRQRSLVERALEKNANFPLSNNICESRFLSKTRQTRPSNSASVLIDTHLLVGVAKLSDTFANKVRARIVYSSGGFAEASAT